MISFSQPSFLLKEGGEKRGDVQVFLTVSLRPQDRQDECTFNATLGLIFFDSTARQTLLCAPAGAQRLGLLAMSLRGRMLAHTSPHSPTSPHSTPSSPTPPSPPHPPHPPCIYFFVCCKQICFFFLAYTLQGASSGLPGVHTYLDPSIPTRA